MLNLKLAKSEPILFTKDALLIIIMAILAGCGLIYQYILSNYAGRVLGVMEHAIFAMIGVMIVSMGIGAFIAKYFKCSYTGFVWLELLIAFFGSCSILLIGGAFALSVLMPEIIATNFGLTSDLVPRGGLIYKLEQFAQITPYILGFIIGVFIGMEIPFIARVRENIYGQHLEHNVGTIYGADYIGAGIGAAIFVVYMLSLKPEIAAIYTAFVNLVAGFLFFIIFAKKIKFIAVIFLAHLLLLLFIIFLNSNVSSWSIALEDMLYQDKVIFSHDTKFQHLTITKRNTKSNQPIYDLYINGRTQFSSRDEHIYHEMLVHPVMLAANQNKNVLIIGGGDGLALREVLKYSPQQVTVLELDREIVEFFSKEDLINKDLIKLNGNSFNDKRVNIIYGDAFNLVDELIAKDSKYDVIISDLPDPSHPNLNKLYSVAFYKKLFHLLTGDGAIVIQSTSPYHAKNAFLTISVTMDAAGFKSQQYHQNIPSFGQWGWTIATKYGALPRNRILKTNNELINNNWITKELIDKSFEFHKDFFKDKHLLEPNRLGTSLIYILHRDAWLNNI